MSKRSRQKITGIMMILLGITIFVATPQSVFAAQVFPTIVPNCDMKLGSDHIIAKADRCDFDDMIQLFINLFDWGLAILSILSVVFFVIGGGYLLLSGGSPERVKTGTSILKNTVFGITIALASWLIVNTIIGILVGSNTLNNVKVFGQTWWGVSTCTETYNQDCDQYALKEGCGDVNTFYVSQLQRLLAHAPGCPNISSDGCFGPQTRNAVLAFNTANGIGIPDTTGIATQQTWEALYANKGCVTQTQTPTIATGTGCCVPRCGTGIDNTADSNGSDGCRDVYTDAIWYNDSCDDNSTKIATGCCVPLNFEPGSTDQCIKNTTQRWCDDHATYRYYDTNCDSNASLCTAGVDECTQ